MYIIYKNNKYFFFMANPKCGSSLLQKLVKDNLNKYTYLIGNKNIQQCNNDISNINYNHCNLEAIIKYIKKKI